MSQSFLFGKHNEKEGNDSATSATPLTLNKVYKGSINGAGNGDADFYSFSIAKTQQVRISIPRKQGSSWYAALYNDNGDFMNSFTTAYSIGVKGNEEQTYILPPGSYYVRIANNSDSLDTPYELSVWTAAPQISPNQVPLFQTIQVKMIPLQSVSWNRGYG